MVPLLWSSGCAESPPRSSADKQESGAPPRRSTPEPEAAAAPVEPKLILEGPGTHRSINLAGDPVVPAARDWTVIEPWERALTIPAHTTPIHTLAASSRGGWVLSLDAAGGVCSWSARETEVVLERCFETEVGAQAERLVALSGGRRLVVAGGPEVQLLGRGGVVVTRFTPRSGRVQLLEAAPSAGLFLIAAGSDLEVNEDAFIATTVDAWTTAAAPVAGVVTDGGAVRWLGASGAVVSRESPRAASVERGWVVERRPALDHRFSPGGTRLASAYRDSLVVRGTDDGGVVEHRLSHRGYRSAELHWTPDSDSIALVGPKEATLWSGLGGDGVVAREFESQPSVSAATLLADGHVVASFDGHTVVFWSER